MARSAPAGKFTGWRWTCARRSSPSQPGPASWRASAAWGTGSTG